MNQINKPALVKKKKKRCNEGGVPAEGMEHFRWYRVLRISSIWLLLTCMPFNDKPVTVIQKEKKNHKQKCNGREHFINFNVI